MFSRKTTTSARVFVDDFVQGSLPEVSVISGTPTRSRLTHSTEIDGPSPGWFVLILLGPVGWLVLALVMTKSRRSDLVGWLPVTNQEYLDYRSTKRRGNSLGIGGFAGLFASLLVASTSQLPEPAVVLFVVASIMVMLSGVVTYRLAKIQLPKISLDGSRRWTTLHGVHPVFAAAVDNRDASAVRVRRS